MEKRGEGEKREKVCEKKRRPIIYRFFSFFFFFAHERASREIYWSSQISVEQSRCRARSIDVKIIIHRIREETHHRIRVIETKRVT